jgi:hypothetical protein
MVQKALAKRPAERYESSAAFKADLQPFIAQDPAEVVVRSGTTATGSRIPAPPPLEATVRVPTGGFAVPPIAKHLALSRVYMLSGALTVFMALIAAYYTMKFISAPHPPVQRSADVIAAQPLPPAPVKVPEAQPAVLPVTAEDPLLVDSPGPPAGAESRENTEKAIQRQRALKALEQ